MSVTAMAFMTRGRHHRDMEYVDAIWPAVTAVAAYVLAEAKNADPDTVAGASRAALVRWLGSLATPLKRLCQSAI
jgi:hypothetical protein